jgi:hypothetical protein
MAALHELADLTAFDGVCTIVVMVGQQQSLHMLRRRKWWTPHLKVLKLEPSFGIKNQAS